MKEIIRYFASHFLHTLETGNLMAGKPSQFNDPFEFAYRLPEMITKGSAKKFWREAEKNQEMYESAKRKYPEITNKKEFKIHMRENRNEYVSAYREKYGEIFSVDPEKWLLDLDEDYRIVCFSADTTLPQEELLLWSMYSAKHQGVRLRFRDKGFSAGQILKDVIYSPNRVVLNSSKGKCTKELAEAAKLTLRTKNDVWSYENERRMFIQPSNCMSLKGDDETTRDFIYFPPTALIGVDCGLRCDPDIVFRVREICQEMYPESIVRVASHHPSEYSLLYKEI